MKSVFVLFCFVLFFTSCDKDKRNYNKEIKTVVVRAYLKFDRLSTNYRAKFFPSSYCLKSKEHFGSAEEFLFNTLFFEDADIHKPSFINVDFPEGKLLARVYKEKEKNPLYETEIKELFYSTNVPVSIDDEYEKYKVFLVLPYPGEFIRLEVVFIENSGKTYFLGEEIFDANFETYFLRSLFLRPLLPDEKSQCIEFKAYAFFYTKKNHINLKS